MIIKKSQFLKRYVWLISSFIGVLGFLSVWLFLPHKSEIDSVWQVIYKLIAFWFLITGISFFPNKNKKLFLLVIIPFFGFLGYLLPRLSYFGFTGAVIISNYKLSGEYYTLLYLLLYPAIILTATFAYRIGGGKPGNCYKIAFSGVIIIFSGYLDLLWSLVNPVEIPEILEYSHHIALFLGPNPTYKASIVFALFHIPVFIAFLLLPLDKWINSIFLFIQSKDKKEIKIGNKNILNNTNSIT